MSKPSEAIGVYLHIPFCRSICPFCSFSTGPRSAEAEAAYLAALKREIVGARPLGRKERLPVDSIYFGGGTPSLLGASEVGEILQAVRWRFEVAADAEISLEVDPGTADRERLAGYRAAGINRLSIGGQSLNDRVLETIGRGHRSREIYRTFEDARSAGFTNLNLDLMVGLPGEGLEIDLAGLEILSPQHGSVYILELAEEVPMARQVRRGEIRLPDEVHTLSAYRMAREALVNLGLRHYEISNFARPAFESRHNLKYWSDQPYLGFGASAHSYLEGTRFWNVRSPARYREQMASQGQAVEACEPYEPLRRAAEHLFTGLRRAEGVSLREVESRYGVSVLERYGAKLRPFFELELVRVSGGALHLTEKGFLVSNEIFQIFL